MKQVLLILAFCVMLTGCSSTPTPARTVAAIEVAASVGVRAALREKPDARAWFEAASVVLDVMLDSDSVDAARVRALLLSLPVKEVRSEEALYYVDDALNLYNACLADLVSQKLDANAQAKTLLAAFNRGIKKALK